MVDIESILIEDVLNAESNSWFNISYKTIKTHKNDEMKTIFAI